jgi:hypothetical protein
MDGAGKRGGLAVTALCLGLAAAACEGSSLGQIDAPGDRGLWEAAANGDAGATGDGDVGEGDGDVGGADSADAADTPDAGADVAVTGDVDAAGDAGATGDASDAGTAVDSAGAGDAADAGTAGDASDASGAGVECCPVDFPSCNCILVGGRRSPGGACARACDVPREWWVSGVDSYGCPILTVRSSGEGYCLGVGGSGGGL